MSEIESEKPSDHVGIPRLLAVVTSNELNLTADEVKHLKECFRCFKLWKQFIREYSGQKQDRATP
jgi:hypothetical protein